MKRASQNLISDHEDILLTLNILERISLLIETNNEVDLVDVIRIIYFMKIFGDEFHHGKEEGILFPAFGNAGIIKQNGMLKEIFAEHERERELINSLRDSVFGESVQYSTFIQTSNSYISLIRDHIKKENYHIFPDGDEMLSDEKQEEILNKFEAFENRIIGKDYYPEYHSMLQKFEKKYLI